MGSERWFRRLSARATPSGTGDSSLHHFESKEPLARPFMSRHHSVPCPTPKPARRVVAHCGSSVSSQLYLCQWQRLNLAFTVACINIYVNARANVANCLEKRWRERNRVNSRIGQPEEAEAKLYCVHAWKRDQTPHLGVIRSQESKRRIDLGLEKIFVNGRHGDLKRRVLPSWAICISGRSSSKCFGYA